MRLADQARAELNINPLKDKITDLIMSNTRSGHTYCHYETTHLDSNQRNLLYHWLRDEGFVVNVAENYTFSISWHIIV